MTVDWSPLELEQHITEIVQGEKLVSFEHNNELQHFLFKYPDSKALKLSEIEYEQISYRAKKDNFKTEEEMMQFMRDSNIWTKEDDEIVDNIKRKINKWSEKSEDQDLSDASRNYATQLVSKLEEDLWKAELKKERMMLHTVERRSRQAKYDYLLWLCLFDPFTNERLGKDSISFFGAVEGDLKNILLTNLLEYLAGHSSEEIRFIARNNRWRVNYIACTKANIPLFPRSVIELTPDQLNLVWWSSYYQSIYEMLPEDQPEDWVIDDDELLDKHMEELHKERTKDTQAKQAERKYGNRTAMKMKEVIAFRSHPDYELLKFDKVPASVTKDKEVVNQDISDDKHMAGKWRKKTKKISKSRRYNPDK